jgi:HAD superfamily hydrolase (TIGR01509 family)
MTNSSKYFNSSVVESAFRKASVIVFDLNGLLIDDELVQLAATNEALGSRGVSFTLKAWEEQCVGRNALEYLQESFPAMTRETIKQVLAVKERAYERLIQSSTDTPWKPGAIELLLWLRKSAMTCAIATSTMRENFDTLDRLLELQKVGKFQCIVCGDEVERAKPDPAIYDKVRQIVGTSERYLVLEDSVNGLRSAVSAAIPCIVVPSSVDRSLQDFPGAELIIDSLRSDARVLGGSFAAPT